MTAEFSPCPFCGKAVRYSTYSDESLWDHGVVPWHSVRCNDCDVEMIQCDDIDELERRWNMRICPPSKEGVQCQS